MHEVICCVINSTRALFDDDKPAVSDIFEMTKETTAVSRIQRWRRCMNHELVRYFLVSLFSLSVDFSIFLLGSQYVHYTVAAVIGFLLGAVAHYLLSIRIVFSRRKFGKRRMTEFVLFVGTAAAGLLVSVVTISVCVEWLGASLFVAKVVAAGMSFLFGYVVRKVLLF